MDVKNACFNKIRGRRSFFCLLKAMEIIDEIGLEPADVSRMDEEGERV